MECISGVRRTQVNDEYEEFVPHDDEDIRPRRRRANPYIRVTHASSSRATHTGTHAQSAFLRGTHAGFGKLSMAQKNQDLYNQHILHKELLDEALLYYNKWRLFDILASIFAVTGLLIATIEYEYSWGIYGDGRMDNRTSNFIILATTVAAVIFLIQRHYYKRIWSNLKIHRFSKLISFSKKIQLNKVRVLIKPSKTKLFNRALIMEMLLLLAFPYPFAFANLEFGISQYKIETGDTVVNVYYQVNEFMYALMFLRVYFLFRVLLSMRSFTDNYAASICSLYGVRANQRFTMKCLLRLNPLSATLTANFVSVIILAALLRIMERPYGQQFQDPSLESFPEMVWLVIITMTTVGYGDIYPHTTLGKVIGIITCLWGSILVSLMVFAVSNVMEFSNEQANAFIVLTNTRSAAQVVIEALQYNLMKKRGDASMSELQAQYRRMKMRLVKFNQTIKKNALIPMGVGSSPDDTLTHSVVNQVHSYQPLTEVAEALYALERKIDELAKNKELKHGRVSAGAYFGSVKKDVSSEDSRGSGAFLSPTG